MKIGLKTFEECIEKVSYRNKVQHTDYLAEGKFPVVSQEFSLINGYWNQESDVFNVEKPVIVFGDHTRVLKYINFSFVLGADGIKIIKPKDFIDPKFFYYFLQANPIKSKGYARHYKFFKKLSLFVPPLSTQQKLVAKLDAIFAEIDKSTVAAETNAKNVETLFQSYLKKVFEHNIDSERIKISDTLKLEYGKSLPDVDRNLNGIYSAYGANGEKARTNKFLYDKPSIIVGRKGSAGELTLVKDKFWALDVTYFVTHDNSKTDLEYLYYALKTKNLSSYAKGVKPGINRNDVYALDIFLPNISIQRMIVGKLNSLFNEVTKSKKNYTDKIYELSHFKNSILKQAFNSELVKAA